MQGDYKKCRTAQELNEYTRNERETKCGYTEAHWSQSGVCTSSKYMGRDNFIHTRQKTVRNNLEEVFTNEEIQVLLQPHVEEKV